MWGYKSVIVILGSCANLLFSTCPPPPHTAAAGDTGGDKGGGRGGDHGGPGHHCGPR